MCDVKSTHVTPAGCEPYDHPDLTAAFLYASLPVVPLATTFLIHEQVSTSHYPRPLWAAGQTMASTINGSFVH